MLLNPSSPEITRCLNLFEQLLTELPTKNPRVKSRITSIKDQAIYFDCLERRFFAEFARGVRELRMKEKMELATLAELLSVSRNWLTKFERGHRKMNVWQMALVAAIFEVDLVQLIITTIENYIAQRG